MASVFRAGYILAGFLMGAGLFVIVLTVFALASHGRR